MPRGSGGSHKLSQAALSSDYRRHLREAGQYLLQVVHSLGGVFTERSSPADVDRFLEKAICHAYDAGEKRYWVVLGVLGIQRALRIAGPLLKNRSDLGSLCHTTS